MAKRRKALEIKKEILDTLRSQEMSVRALETRLRTNNLTIKAQLKELEFLEIVELVQHKKSDRNGRPFTTVKLKKH